MYFPIEEYNDILEYLPDECKQFIKNNNYDTKKEIVKEINNYCLTKNTDTFIVSLSGGVDSMVIASIIHYLNYNCICVHINYNNREESKKESEFILKWLDFNNITYIFHDIQNFKRGEINRNSYEEETKNIRFNLYKKAFEKYPNSKNCVMLGHHKDDVIENIFNNVCRGRNLLDLPIMFIENKIENVIISRPMINLYKKEVFAFAHENNIPYFKNTTPSWSMRGIFREKIYPLLNSTYSNLSINLLKIGQQSREWNKIIQIKIIEPFLDKIIYFEDGFQFYIDDEINSPFSFWNIIFAKIFHSYSKACPSSKSILGFMNYIKIRDLNGKKYKLTNNTLCIIKKGIAYFNFE